MHEQDSQQKLCVLLTVAGCVAACSSAAGGEASWAGLAGQLVAASIERSGSTQGGNGWRSRIVPIPRQCDCSHAHTRVAISGCPHQQYNQALASWAGLAGQLVAASIERSGSTQGDSTSAVAIPRGSDCRRNSSKSCLFVCQEHAENVLVHRVIAGGDFTAFEQQMQHLKPQCCQQGLLNKQTQHTHNNSCNSCATHGCRLRRWLLLCRWW